jgi:tRNA 2-thiouridine synthesizing protein A
MTEYDIELDARGLMCALPLLRLKKALMAMASGQVVLVSATDPASVLDFGVYLDQAGHFLLERREQTGIYYYRIRKS